MLLELTNACELRLGQRPTAAAVSMPSRNIVAHQTTPVADLLKTAFSAANLDYLEIVHYSLFGEPLLYPENVQLAGHSLGLCQPYTSSDHCLEDDDQLRNLTSEVYYLVGYYSGALEAIATTPTALAYGITPDPYPDYRLGANARNDNPDEDFYWQEVRRLLSKPFIRGMIRNPSKIVMYGDHGKDERLTAMVDEIFASFLGDQDMPTWVEDGVDAVFAGAMGAAEFAKRKPYWGLDVVTEGASVVLPKNDL
ncbi:hypothetical protein HII31_00988 [Pseudocercospora fuligena]|uniref:Uncharacterized protein n=1 Tax=Pseudocercospora fuligena TaxID=685502 RepID=A0A8H6RUD5_9PEZI|nr:hypothetical protein HII31_00988 [Pseudocercospora fuligena]